MRRNQPTYLQNQSINHADESENENLEFWERVGAAKTEREMKGSRRLAAKKVRMKGRGSREPHFFRPIFFQVPLFFCCCVEPIPAGKFSGLGALNVIRL